MPNTVVRRNMMRLLPARHRYRRRGGARAPHQRDLSGFRGRREDDLSPVYSLSSFILSGALIRSACPEDRR